MQEGGFEPPKALSHQITPALKMPPFSYGHPALFSLEREKGGLSLARLAASLPLQNHATSEDSAKN